MVKIFKEPLFQFLVLGAFIFLFNFLQNDKFDTLATQSNKVDISKKDIEHFIYVWKKTYFRSPTDKELNNLINARIKEEILYREALLLNLDKDDPMIKQRLAQKLRFLSEGFSEQGIPKNEVIEKFYQDNNSLFLSKTIISFKQVFINFQNEKWSEDSIQNLLSKLNNQTADISNSGDASLLLTHYQDKDQETIKQMFGDEFSEQLIRFHVGEWQGPVFSSYGAHLVIVSQREEASLIPLAQVREKIIELLLENRRAKAEQDYYDSLRSHYQISVADFNKTDFHSVNN